MTCQDQTLNMEEFLESIERRAYRMASFACHNRDDALELVQDAMCQFIGKYANKPQEEWKALFYRILQNRIRDFYRRERVRSRWRVWLSTGTEDNESDPLENLVDTKLPSPEVEIRQKQAFSRLEQGLKRLSLKQQQVFLLRAWEELSVAETAKIMGCSEGTVKSHYFRATERLKAELGEDWP